MADVQANRFGDWLRQAREALELSVRRAAQLADLSEGRWRQLEQGYQRVGSGDAVVSIPANPSERTVRNIAAALDLDLSAAMAAAGMRIPKQALAPAVIEPDDVALTPTEVMIVNDVLLSMPARQALLSVYAALTSRDPAAPDEPKTHPVAERQVVDRAVIDLTTNPRPRKRKIPPPNFTNDNH